jgi:NAD(P)-dependent dehydrogenase (short-subunit alcohol dehydrogenase family)
MIHNFFDLTGKVAFVAGTSRGLGQYFARALARAGARHRDEQPRFQYACSIR